MKPSKPPAAIYRLWDRDNQLLYIGCSPNPLSRIHAHTRIKAWATAIASATLEWFDSHEQAKRAEALAIAAELPEWNVHHRPNPKHSIGILCREFSRDNPETWVAK